MNRHEIEELSDQVWKEYSDDLSRRTIGVDISLAEIIEMVKEVEEGHTPSEKV